MRIKKGVFIITLATILAANANASQTENQRALSIELTKSVIEINANVPRTLDAETRLDSAATFAHFIIYNNTMINYTADQLDVKLLDPIIKETVIDNLCKNKGLAGLIAGGVTMVYRYHGKKSQFITELSKDMSTCL